MKSETEYKIKKLREIIAAGEEAYVLLRGAGSGFQVDRLVKLEPYGCEVAHGSVHTFFDPNDVLAVAGLPPA